MKKIFSLFLVLAILALTTSFGYARMRMPEVKFLYSNKGMHSIEKRVQAIAPKTTTEASVQLTAQIEAIKKTIVSNNAIYKKIAQKKSAIEKLIHQIKRKKISLSSSQYNAVNNLLASVNSEAKLVKSVKGFDNRGIIMSKRSFNKYTSEDLTNIQNILNQNTVHLNNISASYDSIVSLLTGVASTTSSAVNLPITTMPAISN